MTNAIVAAILLTASWERFSDEGKIAANGKPYNPTIMTCASRTIPLGTKLRVTDVANGKSVVVTVTDRTHRRFANRIDLSAAAFKKLNGLELGLCKVRVEILSPPRSR